MLGNIGLIGVLTRVILMVWLGWVERGQGFKGSDNGPGEDFTLVELCDVRLGDVFLLIVGVENSRTVLRADIGALAIELCRVMSHGEKDFKQFPEADDLGIVGDLNGFGVLGFSGADGLVVGVVLVSPCVSGNDIRDPGNLFKDGFGAPKTPACQNKSGGGLIGFGFEIGDRIGKGLRVCTGAGGLDQDDC